MHLHFDENHSIIPLPYLDDLRDLGLKTNSNVAYSATVTLTNIPMLAVREKTGQQGKLRWYRANLAKGIALISKAAQTQREFLPVEAILLSLQHPRTFED